MSATSSDQEPSIEEILASIRQIISDDDEEEAAPPVPAPKAAAPKPEPVKEPEPVKDDVFELTESMMEEPEIEPDLDPVPAIDMQSFMDDMEEEKQPIMAPESVSTIISDSAATAALRSMAKLTGSMPISRTSGYSGVTVEDIVRELLSPMLREWVDDNLPPLVERLVQKELEKLARKALDS